MISTPTATSDTCPLPFYAPSATRMAFVVHNFGPAGLEHCVARLVNHLDPTRYRPMIVCMTTNGAAARWLNSAADVPIVELQKRAGNDPRVVRDLARVFQEHGIELVHSNNWGTLVETVLARIWAGVPVHVHAERGTVLGAVQLGTWQRRLRGPIMRWALARTDAVVAVSEAVRQRLLERSGFPRERIDVIPNGVEAPEVDDPQGTRARIRAKLGISADAMVVGSVGTLKPVKDYGTAIDAVATVAAKGLDVHLMLVGGGPDEAKLLEQAELGGLAGRIHLAGHQFDVGSWMTAMDVYINSSVSEGMSQAILEAMSMGLPLVVTDVGDSSQAVGKVDACGLVVPPSSPSEMANAIEWLLTDQELRRRMSRNARRRHVTCFGPELMVRSYEELYFRAGSRSRRRALPIRAMKAPIEG